MWWSEQLRPFVRVSGSSGVVSTELAILAPLFVAMVMMVSLAGLFAKQDARAQSAADAAARTASYYRPGSPEAKAAATRALADHCGVNSTVDSFTYEPATMTEPGQVSISVTCIQRYRGFGLLTPEAARAVTSRSVATVEYWRSSG